MEKLRIGGHRMSHRVAFLFLISLMLAAGATQARAQGAPLQLLDPRQATPNTSAAGPAHVPKNWKIVDNGRDPLTEKPSRWAITLPKSDSTKSGKPGAVGLILRCLSNDLDGPTHPAATLVFTSLANVGNYKRFPINYRFDEEAVHGTVLTSAAGKGGVRNVGLPSLVDDRFADIGATKQLRIEIDLRTAGVMFLDFDVSGAAEASKALACR